MHKYNTMEEWFKDFELFEANPNDEHLLKALKTRVNNSSDSVKTQVQVFLQNRALETNPFEVFGRVAKEVGSEFFVVVNSESDPWFQA